MLILLVDVSQSTWPFIKVFREILRSLTSYFNKHNDRVGLISLQGTQAAIYSHPTHNFRVVARGLGRLRIHGETPLADGLRKSLHMAKLEKGKNPGSRGIVILLSDCYPEPITPGYEDRFDDPVYKEAVNAAVPFKRARITLLVINPAFTTETAKYPGELLSKKISQASGGRLIKLYRPKHRRHVPPSKKEIDHILKGVEDSL
jgi:Mg-chelatase subunit ChlD